MTNPYTNGYESLQAAAYMPGDTSAMGIRVAHGYRIELEAPEGPEMGNDTLGHISTTGETLASASQNLAQLLYNFNWRGELIIRREQSNKDLIVFDLSKTADFARVEYVNVEAVFGWRERNYATQVRVQTPGTTDEHSGCGCSGETPHEPSDPPMNARQANQQAREERLRDRRRQEQERYKDTELSVNPYNTMDDTYTFARFEQSKKTLHLMAEWLEEQGGLTTHLAGAVVMALHDEMNDPGSTYRQISEVGWRPNEDVSVIEVEDAEEDMDLIIEVKKLYKG